jgi:hypothetical protein
MSRLSLVALAAALCSCSVLFDPGKVDSGQPNCPLSTASCPTRENADVACDNETCVYSCKDGFSDRNLDLNDATSNGCEVSCANDPGTVNPPFAIANVGLSGEAIIAWPPSNPSADVYKVCTTLPSGEKCEDVPALLSCNSNGACTTTVTGLPDNQRVTTTVRAGSFCKGLASTPPPPVVSYTSINGTTRFGFDIDGACGATISDTGNGVMSVSQGGGLFGCLTVFSISDNQWSDGSVEVELNIASSGASPTAVGVAIQTDQMTSYAVAGATTLQGEGLCTTLPYRTGPGLNETHLTNTGSIFCGEAGKWTHLKLVGSQGVFSLWAATEGQTLKELTRWPSPVAGASGKKGRPALFFYSGPLTQGTALLRNFRVSTDSALTPNPGPSSVTYNFAGTLPPEWKLQKSGAATDPSVATCPTLASASGCQILNGCAPASGASCLRLQHAASAGGFAAIDLPLGIDVSKPWSVSMHVANQAVAANSLSLIRSIHGHVLDVVGADTQPLRVMTVPIAATFENNKWHHAALNFDPDGGTVLTLDGTTPVTVQRPPDWDRHPGFLVFGKPDSNASYNVFITDLTISQP